MQNNFHNECKRKNAFAFKDSRYLCSQAPRPLLFSKPSQGTDFQDFQVQTDYKSIIPLHRISSNKQAAERFET